MSISEFIHAHGSNQSILWSPLKNRMPKYFTIANFGHPASFEILAKILDCP